MLALVAYMRITWIMVTCGVFCVYTYDPNWGQRKFANCSKLPKAGVLGSYIREIHQVAMIHVIYTLIARYKDACVYKVVYMRYILKTCASIGQWPPLVYICLVASSARQHPDTDVNTNSLITHVDTLQMAIHRHMTPYMYICTFVRDVMSYVLSW